MPRKRHKKAKFADPNAIVMTPGDTLLHLHIRQGGTNLTAFLHEVGIIVAAEMAKTPNDRGRLPLDELIDMPLAVEHKKTLYDILVALCRFNELGSLEQPVNGFQVLFDFNATFMTRLGYHLWMAAAAVNNVRSQLKVSATHPQTNQYLPAIQEALDKKIIELRNETDLVRKVAWKNSSPAVAATTEFIVKQHHLSTFTRHQLGNCEEYARLALAYLQGMDSTLQAEGYFISNGDHVFAVIGRDSGSSFSDYKQWGESAVVCDAWAGKVYPAAMLEAYLGDFRWFCFEGKDYVNVVTKFNPTYHQLMPLPLTYDATDSDTDESTDTDDLSSTVTVEPEDYSTAGVDLVAEEKSDYTELPLYTAADFDLPALSDHRYSIFALPPGIESDEDKAIPAAWPSVEGEFQDDLYSAYVEDQSPQSASDTTSVDESMLVAFDESAQTFSFDDDPSRYVALEDEAFAPVPSPFASGSQSAFNNQRTSPTFFSSGNDAVNGSQPMDTSVERIFTYGLTS